MNHDRTAPGLALVSVSPELVEAIAAEVEARLLHRLGERDRDPWPEWMGVERAAAYLDVSPERVRKLIARGALPSYSEGVGCRRFLRRSDLDAAMAGLQERH